MNITNAPSATSTTTMPPMNPLRAAGTCGKMCARSRAASPSLQV